MLRQLNGWFPLFAEHRAASLLRAILVKASSVLAMCLTSARCSSAKVSSTSRFEYQFVILQVDDHNFELPEKIDAQQAVYSLP